jgi:hypothetical protein
MDATCFQQDMTIHFIDIFKLFLQHVHRKDKDKTKLLKKKSIKHTKENEYYLLFSFFLFYNPACFCQLSLMSVLVTQ